MSFPEIVFVDLKEQTRRLRPEIFQAISQVCESADFSGGRFVEAFERSFASFLRCDRFAGVSSGSDALMLSLLALGVGPGDEVIVPANTYIATAFAAIRVGAIPVFADCDPHTWEMDPASVSRAITSKTRAIIGVHLYGQAFPVEEVAALATDRGLLLIEDCAQAQGTLYRGKPVGTLSDAGCFSFYPTKTLGACGQAGGIAMRDEEADQRVRLLREQGSREQYVHEAVGYNMRMDGFQAAILSVKLPHLAQWNERRAQIVGRYHAQIHNPRLRLQKTMSHTCPAWYLAVAWVDDRPRFMHHLKTLGILCGIHYPIPCHLQKSLSHLHYRQGDFPNAEELANHCVSLPLYPELCDEDVTRVIEACNAYGA